MMDHILQPLPPHLCLPVCVTYFWMNNCKPKPSHPLFQAILLGMVYGELSWRRAHPNGDPFFTQHLSQVYGLRCRKSIDIHLKKIHVHLLYLLINFQALITLSHIVLLSLSCRSTVWLQSFCFCMSAIISAEGHSRTKEGPRYGCGPFAQPMAVLHVGGNGPEPVTVFPTT